MPVRLPSALAAIIIILSLHNLNFSNRNLSSFPHITQPSPRRTEKTILENKNYKSSACNSSWANGVIYMYAQLRRLRFIIVSPIKFIVI